MNAFTNGANERRMKQILEEELPGVVITTSSEVLPEIFEHERFSTTVVNAILARCRQLLRRLGERLREGGYARDLLLLHSGGGVMTTRVLDDFAARLAGSGIAAGAIASRYIASQCGFPNSIGLDMGGTTDVSLAWDGKSRVTKDWHIEFGYRSAFQYRGIDHRRRRRFARVDRRRWLAAQRPAIGRRQPRPRLLRAWQHGADQQRRQCRARPTRQRPCWWLDPA